MPDRPPAQKVAAFYQFVPLPDAAILRPGLFTLCAVAGLKGTILLAPEGINGTIAGEPDALDRALAALIEGPLFGGRLGDLAVKLSSAVTPPFGRLKVRLKREIVTLGDTSADPARSVGTYVEATAWNALLDDPAVTLIDTRNAFEVAMGTFEGALDPGLSKFSDFRAFAAGTLDPARHRNVAMFCTGGIRCEKASALLMSRGFQTVYHLKGGILGYLDTVPADESRWRGHCFVFDDRVGLGHGLVPMLPDDTADG